MTPTQAKHRRYRERHRVECAERSRAWKAANVARCTAYATEWRNANPKRYRTTQRRRLAEGSARNGIVLRNAIHQALRQRASGRDWRADARIGGVLGCSKPDLIAHLEALFLPGMSWSNYGRKGWEIDHIKPCATFDLTRHDQVLACFHFTNLRPLWRSDNLRRPRKDQHNGSV